MKYIKYIGIVGIVLSTIAATTDGASAQGFNASNLSVNAGFLYGLDMEDPGIQIGAAYAVTEQIRAGLDYTYWLVDSPAGVDINYSELNLNGHYIFMQNENLGLYGIGTLGMHFASIDFNNGTSSSDSDFAVGIGAGAEYAIGPVKAYFEPRFFLSGFDQLNLGVGIRYGF